jgi:hypothetical protein
VLSKGLPSGVNRKFGDSIVKEPSAANLDMHSVLRNRALLTEAAICPSEIQFPEPISDKLNQLWVEPG